MEFDDLRQYGNVVLIFDMNNSYLDLTAKYFKICAI